MPFLTKGGSRPINCFSCNALPFSDKGVELVSIYKIANRFNYLILMKKGYYIKNLWRLTLCVGLFWGKDLFQNVKSGILKFGKMRIYLNKNFCNKKGFKKLQKELKRKKKAREKLERRQGRKDQATDVYKTWAADQKVERLSLIELYGLMRQR